MNLRILLPIICAVLGVTPAFSGSRVPAPIALSDFHLTGELTNGQAQFTLQATARVENSKGGSLEILSGPIALTDAASHPKWKVKAGQSGFVLDFERAGQFPIELKFAAAVRQKDGWNSVDFRVAPTVLQPVTLRGLPEATQFEFAGAARPERAGTNFKTFLPPDGTVKLAWKETQPETEGKLFYSAEMLSQVSVSPGLVRQVALVDFKVMQGELTRVALRLRGPGEVTRVQGEQVLAWEVQPGTGTGDRRLVVQFNQPQKTQFTLQLQTQAPLGAFPQTADVLQVCPEAATRFAGYYRVVNEGAVRLEVAQATALSQVSPEQFPETEGTRALLRPTGNQRFAYRFSGGEAALRVQADQVLPELSVSELLTYRLGESELAIDCELEVDIREAPLRELLLRVPKGYNLARVTAQGLSDYFLRDVEDSSQAELRLVYGQPASGRQVVQLRLERNKALGESAWDLPRVEVPKTKSVRGHVAVAADTGFRLSAARTEGITEVATALFPRKVPGIQTAFRLSEPGWQAALRVERLPQTVQVDALHLFSIAEGIAYGSSVLNYTVSGAPLSTFRVALSPEYFNVEFTGKDVRGYRKEGDGYLVQLHSGVSGSYTLLATYERPFKGQGETLTFTGARPLDAQSEQGHTLITSAYQFQVKPAEVSPGLTALETGEVPPEYRLFFDAPVLAVYRYGSRPFELKLALSPLAQGDSLSQVADRASFTTRISKEGQALTDARYYVKSRGNPHLRLTLPADTQLWAAAVNGTPVVPVKDSTANLVPLPQGGDPNAVLAVELKLASTSAVPDRVSLALPRIAAATLLAEWKLEPDAGQKLILQRGSLRPAGAATDISGFAVLARTLGGSQGTRALAALAAGLLLLAAALVVWRWALGTGVSRLSARHVGGMILGLLALCLAVSAFNTFYEVARGQRGYLPRDISFVAPVQPADTVLTAEVLNLPEKWSPRELGGILWPALLGLGVWAYGWTAKHAAARRLSWAAGWTALGWAALRAPNGLPWFMLLLVLYFVFHVVIPVVRQSWRLPPAPVPPEPPQPTPTTAAAGTALLMAGLITTLLCGAARAEAAKDDSSSASQLTNTRPRVVADSVIQELQVEEKFALATTRIHWQAQKGEALPVLAAPAVLTGICYPTNVLKLLGPYPPQPTGSNTAGFYQVFAEKPGSYDLQLQYQLQWTKREDQNGLVLPVPFGVVNRLRVTVPNADVDVVSTNAVSLQREMSGSNTIASLVLAPASDTWVGWKPRTRDLKGEKPVFYTELTQLYVPAAGIIEGAHYVYVRPAQGELGEIAFRVPAGATVTDVLDPAALKNESKPARALVSLWRFDPDARKLRVTLSSPQSRPFVLLVRTQTATGPLPLDCPVGLLSVENAAGQIGLLGVATGNEVQLDSVTADALSPVNLEDYPSVMTTLVQGQTAGLTVRRAFRYADQNAVAKLKASAVEPDVRVEVQETLSLGEDRTVLAANASVDITRAGIFRLSFVLPPGFDVETISGPALSHWTEAKTEAARVITMHLNGKTEGKQTFDISLAAAGVKATNGWPVPQFVLREASKQRGSLLLVPEQGLRLQAVTTEGLTPVDPQKSGIKQKGVLAFRVLQTPRTLVLNLEQVDPWIQVTSLQHATFNEAQAKVLARLQYQIENTGLKTFRVWVPTNAEGVRFQGEQLADFLPLPNLLTNGLQTWEIKLHRRVIGSYQMEVTYQIPLGDKAADAVLRGVQAADVNLQRGFVTIQSAGRLQLGIAATPEALQSAEWQSIPRSLQQGLASTAAHYCYRLVEPAFALRINLQRHEVAKLLPARINRIGFNSVVADDGAMLTRAVLEIAPGNKRLLNLKLPKGAKFWFAFVNQNGVWPWREGEQLLVPLEQPAQRDKVISVELFYSCQGGTSDARSLDLELVAPRFDLPLENITWRISLGDKWQVRNWAGSLQLEREQTVSPVAALELRSYLEGEAAQQRERTKAAEGFLQAGNSALEQGDPQMARRSFQAAYGLSTHDAAFNEDARVQLHNLKLQQALIGLNVRQAPEPAALGGKFRDLSRGKEVAYTQQDAKQMLERNTADDNAAFMRLAERLVQQQDAAVSSPAALRANLPEQGRVLTFQRAVAVDSWADLNIKLQAEALAAATPALRAAVLIGVFLLVALLAWAGRQLSHANSKA